jgi:hypothetical protein
VRPALDKRDLALLSTNLKSRHLDTRQFCAAEIARLGADIEPIQSAVIAALADPDPLVRGRLYAALGARGPAAKDAVPSLTETITTIVKSDSAANGSADLLRQAMDALGKIATPAEAALVWSVCLKAKNMALRKEMVLALTALGEPARRLVGDLCKMLDDPELGPLAAEALQKLGGPDVAKALARVVDKGPRGAKMTAIRVLETMGKEGKPAAADLAEAARIYRGTELGKAASEALKQIEKK